MSSCLIINPAFHAYVNFIITDTCIHSEGCRRAHAHTPTHALFLPNCQSWRAVASKTAVSHLTLSPSSFPRLLFPASVTSHVFSLSLFPIQSLSHLLPLSALPTCHRDSTPKRSDVFFLLFVLYSSPISGEFTFLKYRHKGSISPVSFCPPTCKTQSHPPPPSPPNPSSI